MISPAPSIILPHNAGAVPAHGDDAAVLTTRLPFVRYRAQLLMRLLHEEPSSGRLIRCNRSTASVPSYEAGGDHRPARRRVLHASAAVLRGSQLHDHLDTEYR